MDLVSIETKAESDWINQQLNGEYLRTVKPSNLERLQCLAD